MHIAARFSSLVLAQQASEYLRGHGIVAGMVGDLIGVQGPIAGGIGEPYVVVVGKERDVLVARELLVELRRRGVELDADWEVQTEPDLTLLDAAYLPRCPGCGELLDIDESRCPLCGFEVDVVSLIVEQHGPEALSDCYPDEPIELELSAEQLSALDVSCEGCGYSLRGLEPVGVCPECGARYDKLTPFR